MCKGDASADETVFISFEINGVLEVIVSVK